MRAGERVGQRVIKDELVGGGENVLESVTRYVGGCDAVHWRDI